ncbi:hypothetical protein [Corynebacterium variabile]|uniref:hypothetical protein n=1 Tax=Corynebacterium variabile TaxID=1727 RepID=UPI0028E4CF0F|nr:hypothetical protein [Corynebacterium variabile]
MAAELPFHGTRRHAGELGDIARCCGDESAVGDEGGRRVEDVGTGITVRVVGRETAGRVVVKGAGSLGEWPWASELPTVVLVSEAVMMGEPSVVGCVVSTGSPSGRLLRLSCSAHYRAMLERVAKTMYFPRSFFLCRSWQAHGFSAMAEGIHFSARNHRDRGTSIMRSVSPHSRCVVEGAEVEQGAMVRSAAPDSEDPS